jgi:uncharacterized protein YerC
MTDAPTIRYHYKAETVQDLARSLIVASTICDAQGFVRPQFTPAQARQLASALENMAIMETVRAAALAEVERQDRSAGLSVAAIARAARCGASHVQTTLTAVRDADLSESGEPMAEVLRGYQWGKAS